MARSLAAKKLVLRFDSSALLRSPRFLAPRSSVTMSVVGSVFSIHPEKGMSLLPDASHIVAIRLIIVVRVAVIQVHVVRVRAIVLRRGPVVVGGQAYLLPTFVPPPFILGKQGRTV